MVKWSEWECSDCLTVYMKRKSICSQEVQSAGQQGYQQKDIVIESELPNTKRLSTHLAALDVDSMLWFQRPGALWADRQAHQHRNAALPTGILNATILIHGR